MKNLFYIPTDKLTGPVDHSSYNYVKLSFKEGLDPNFVVHLSDTITKRIWEVSPLNVSILTSSSSNLVGKF